MALISGRTASKGRINALKTTFYNIYNVQFTTACGNAYRNFSTGNLLISQIKQILEIEKSTKSAINYK